MNLSRVTLAFVFLVTWLAVFAQTQFVGLRHWLGIPLAVVPALVSYTALTHGIAVTTALSVLAGLWIDSLSASRLGVSVGPLFLLGFLLHLRRHLILRDQRYAQFWIGFGAGVSVNLLVLMLLSAGQREPISGWFSLWQIPMLGILNGAACPGAFVLFDALERTFGYRPATQSGFRSDREIVRGRHDRIH
jgi:cell shape-determining protein MreD